jgi:hypothetical protein
MTCSACPHTETGPGHVTQGARTEVDDSATRGLVVRKVPLVTLGLSEQVFRPLMHPPVSASGKRPWLR